MGPVSGGSLGQFPPPLHQQHARVADVALPLLAQGVEISSRFYQTFTQLLDVSGRCMQDKREMMGSGLAGFLIKNRTSVDSVAKLMAHRPEKGSVPGFKTRFPRSQEKNLKKAISSSCANVQAMLLQKKLMK